MNKGSVIRCLTGIGPRYDSKAFKSSGAFTEGKEYKILAGLGDGDISRVGVVGAFLLGDKQMCLKDDTGDIRLIKFDSRWEMVEEAAPTNPPRIPVTHLHTPEKLKHVSVAVMGEFSAADASPSNY